jgi:hypothetical protein
MISEMARNGYAGIVARLLKHSVFLQVSIVQKEGVGALFKGALPRAIWTAPLGAMNFAGAVTYMSHLSLEVPGWN